MKKKILIITSALLLALTCVPVYADHGMPIEPSYTAAISIYGADYYREYQDYENGNVSGRLDGGTRFYVWEDYNNGWILGTENANASSDDYESFVYISPNDLVNESTTISPDVGEKEASPVKAITTDELNVRSGPGIGFKVLKILKKDTELTYDYTFNTYTKWMYVQADGTQGWVSGDYLRTITAPDVSAETNNTQTSEPAVTKQEPAATEQETQSTAAADKRTAVAGIILICVGVAVLIAAFVLYYLRQNKRKVESLKVKE